MFYDKEKINISILFHGVEYDNYKAEINKEMFVNICEIEKLVKFLIKKNFKFLFCNEKINNAKTCSISFDDGYSGIKKFDEFSKEHYVPYTIFLNSYNILNNSPFIWDIYKYTFGKDFDFLCDYKKEYRKISPGAVSEIAKNKIYMPLTSEDIFILDKNPLVKFSLHTHYHQVLMGNNFEKYNEEITENISFLQNYKNSDYKAIALPCGFYDQKLLEKLSDNFDKIFTINGGIAKDQKIVNRISLVNTKNFSLLDQIEYFKSNIYVLKRYLVNKKYYFLSKIKIV
jgi:peptidoglycan/xylan/chitin deacetylase (PgdA/CDA1 family)